MANLAQLLLLKEAVDAASEQWEREQAERRRREAEEHARQEAIEAERSRQAKPKQAKNPPPVFPFFWWELASGTSVHMNGRIYDPLLGRMLSADPHIQSPSNLQNYNRYSYVLNNPVSMTDPSGFFFKKLFKSIKKFVKKFWKPLVAIALAAFTAGYAAIALFGAQGGLLSVTAALFTGSAGLGIGASIAVGAIGGFAGGLLTGGLRGGLLGALTGGIAGGIGFQFGADGPWKDIAFKELARASAHGVTGGTVNELAGGEFGAGFAGSFAASFAGHLGPTKNAHLFAKVTQAAVVGGTVSEATGGKFENGAVTAGFQALFNDLLSGDSGSATRAELENAIGKGADIRIGYGYKKGNWLTGVRYEKHFVAEGVATIAADADYYFVEGGCADPSLEAVAFKNKIQLQVSWEFSPGTSATNGSGQQKPIINWIYKDQIRFTASGRRVDLNRNNPINSHFMSHGHRVRRLNSDTLTVRAYSGNTEFLTRTLNLK